MRVAVIGTGIAGLGAAHALARVHEVEVFERDARAGGHAHTVAVPRAAGGELGLDTGFLVHNEHNYPRLSRLFRELGVAVQDSRMSFSVVCERHGLEYSAVRLWQQPRALVHPGFAGLLRDIVRFLRTGQAALEERHARSTLDDFVRSEGYSRSFRDHYLVPFASALWSTAPTQTLSSPASYAVRFFQNHGLLGFRRRTWRTVVGGSRRYVAAITAPLGERLRLGAEVRAVTRDADGVEVRTADDRAHRFEAVVIATHAPQALAMLTDADDLERAVLEPFRTTLNRHRAAHRPLCAPPPALGLGRLELPGGRLPLSRAAAHRDLPPQYAPDPRRAGAVLRDAQPRRPHRRGSRDPQDGLRPSPLQLRGPCRAGPPALARRPPTHLVLRRLPRLRLPRGRARVGRSRGSAGLGAPW